MLHIISAPEDAALVNRLKSDLQAAGYPVNGDLPRGSEHLLIVVLSPAAWSNANVQATTIRALDNSQHIIAVLAGSASLPKLIAHISALDFTADYPIEALKALVDRLSAPGAPLPMRVLTPTVRRANSRIGYWLFVLVLLCFIAGVLLVGVFRVQAPTEEYNTIATFAQATINVYVGRNLPRTTEDALNFPMTLQAAPTAQRPLLIATATRLAGGRSATATPPPS
jgi:hypothetical protein